MKKLVYLLALVPSLLIADSPPKTLYEMGGILAAPASLSESVVDVIDAQRVYVDGALPLVGVDTALAQGRRLLARARASGIPIIHVVHRGGGKLFNPDSPYFAIAEPSLLDMLKKTGRKKLIVVGFMTHMCLESTVRAALDLGYTTTVVASVTATRDLPDGQGGSVPAARVQEVALAALADRFATVVWEVDEIPE
ncbi:MAG: isochorismatase family protein [Candidatus Thiodiazotropha sp.]